MVSCFPFLNGTARRLDCQPRHEEAGEDVNVFISAIDSYPRPCKADVI